MESARWLVLTPLVVAIATGAAGPGGPAGLAGTAWEPAPCTTEATAPPGGTTWYRLEAVLDRTGTLAGRRLVVGVGDAAGRSLDLAPESFASGPVAGSVLLGSDDGARSRVSRLDVARGCVTAVAIEEAAVIRSAVLAPDGRTAYEHRVDRMTRADLGVWRRAPGGPPERVLEGLAPDRALGPTFVTTLVVAPDGRLTASSCAPGGCRVRVLDPASGEVVLVRGTGPGLGTADGDLIVREACPGLPCPVVAVELETGRRTIVVADAFAAALGGLAGDRLVGETIAGSLVVVDLGDGGRARHAGPGVPLSRGSTATAGAEGPAGSVPLAGQGPDGRRTVGILHVDTLVLTPAAPRQGGAR